MSRYFRLWLRERLIGLVGVQQCGLMPENSNLNRAYPVDMRVTLWTGNVIHIYLLNEALKTRTIKNILQNDTNQSIGSLFILAPELIPPQGESFGAPEWLMALHAINNERIYTYPTGDEEMVLLQVHFERSAATETYQSMYGEQPVQFERLHYGKSAVKPNYIKGFWAIAHFGKEAFWQGQRRASYTYAQQRRYVPPHSQQSQRPNHGSSTTADPAPAAPQTRLQRCYAELGLSANASYEDLKVAFRQRVFSVHPDVSALPKVIAEEKFRALTEAYETIKEHHGWV